MAKNTLLQLLHNKCAKVATTDSVLLSAIIQVESSWRSGAMKFEPSYTYLCNPQEFAFKNGIDLITERCLQRFSYGLGQIMGGACRELGFDGMLPELLDPSLNMDYMLKFFDKTCGQYVYTSDKIAAYNAGSAKRLANGTYFNQGYVDKVLRVLEQDQTWKAAQAAALLSNMPH